jgi:hypothetical protein
MFDYFSMETGLQLEEYDDSVPCFVTRRCPDDWEENIPPDRFFIPPDRFAKQRCPDDCDTISIDAYTETWALWTNAEETVVIKGYDEIFSFADDYGIPMTLLDWFKARCGDNKAWIRGPPRNGDVHPIEPAPMPVLLANRDDIIEALMAKMNNGRVYTRVQSPAPPPQPPIPISIPVESVPPTEAVHQEPIAEPEQSKKKKRRRKKKTVPFLFQIPFNHHKLLPKKNQHLL